MPAPVTFVRATLTDSDTLNAAAFNALTAPSATVPDAVPGTAGVMPATTTLAGLALINALDAAAQRIALGLGSLALQAAGAVAITGGAINGTPIGATTPSTVAATTLSATGIITTGTQVTSSGSNALRLQAPTNTSVTIGVDGGSQLVVLGYAPAQFSQGLAVTGTLSATGVINTANNTSYSFKDSGGTLRRGVLMDSANDVYIGAVDNAIASNLYLTAGGAGGVVRQQVNGSTVTAASSTGLAVTGALSATGAGFNGGFARFESTTSGNSIDIKGVNGAGVNDSAFITLRDGTSGRDSFIGLTGDAAPGGAGNIRFATGGNVVRAILGSTGLQVTGALSATGDVGVGTASPSQKLQVSGSAAATYALITNTGTGPSNLFLGAGNAATQLISRDGTTGAVPIVIILGTTEIGRISTTGLAVTGLLTATNGITSNFDNGTAQGINIRETTDATNANFVVFRRADATGIGSITRVTTTNAVAYNTTSDRRIKENFGLLTDSGRLIDLLTPRTFDRKDGTDADRKGWLGFVAQEVHAADPVFARIGFVTVGDDDPTEITKTWGVSSSPIDALLVAEIQSLRARVAQLEAA
jgi:hypothetical protein